MVVFDDRPEYANTQRFPEAYEIRVTDFSKAFEGLEIDADSFIVIVTRGHMYDRAVLEQALKTKAGYIGMISSRKKRAAIYEALMAQGVKWGGSNGYTPLSAWTSAVKRRKKSPSSIVAELIKVRSEQTT